MQIIPPRHPTTLNLGKRTITSSTHYLRSKSEKRWRRPLTGGAGNRWHPSLPGAQP